MANNTVKFDELTEKAELLLTDLLGVSDDNGVLYNKDLQGLQTFLNTIGVSGYKGIVTANVGGIPQLNGADITEDGVYIVGENGDFGTFTGLDISDNVILLDVKDLDTTAVYSKAEIPITLTIDATPTEGSTNVPESGGVFDELTLKLDKTSVTQTIGSSTSKTISQAGITYLTSIETDVTGTLTTGLLNPDGTITNSANWRVTDFISIDANNGFIFNATEYPATIYATVIVYDANDVIQEVILKDDARLNNVIVYDYDYKIRCNARQTGADLIEVLEYAYIKNIALNLENQVSTNISNIAENTSNILAINENPYLGKTKTNYTFPNIGYINSSGVYVANVNYQTTNLLEIGDFYATYDFRLVVLDASAINFYDTNGDWMSTESAVYKVDGVFVDSFIEMPVGARYVRISSRADYATSEVYTLIDTLEIEFNSLGNPNRFYQVDVANFGDSITWYDKKTLAVNSNGGTGGGVMCVGYIQILANTLGFNSYDNQGASGKSITTENWVQISAYDFTNIDLVTIAHGTNDFKLNRAIGTIGSITDTTFDTDTFYGAYRNVLNAIKNSNTNCEVFLLTPIQRDNAGYTIESTNTAGFKLVDYVNAIKALGEMYSLKVIDLYGESGINFYNVFDFTIDGLHPNNAGQLKMGNAVLRNIV